MAAETDFIHDRVRGALARVEQRYTKGRRRLVELLAAAGRPVSLPELLEKDRDLPQSSVYRNLDVFQQAGLVNRIIVGSDRARFELAEPLMAHHHHLICDGCGSVEDVRLDDEFERLVDTTLESVAFTAGFAPSHHNVDLHGRCSACAA